jgi:hypothetical protein
MELISNTYPEWTKAWRNPSIMENWAATNWLRTSVETMSPCPKAASKKTEVERSKTRKDPRKGTSNR